MTKLSMSEEEMLKRKYTRPYEKRIAELEDKLANADYQLEGRDNEIRELEKENAELKADNDARKFAMDMSEKVEKRLRDENAELKGKLLEQKQYTEFKCNEAVKKKEIYEREHFLLTKAKELIKKFSEFVNNGIEYDPEHPQEHTDLWNKLCEEAEQFLKE